MKEMYKHNRIYTHSMYTSTIVTCTVCQNLKKKKFYLFLYKLQYTEVKLVSIILDYCLIQMDV